MSMNAEFPVLRPVHPFPARMAPSIFRQQLSARKRPMCVLDPMSGSGTTVVVARLQGHQAIGFDTDPLALVIATAWSTDIDPKHLRAQAMRVVSAATGRYRHLSPGDAYPSNADGETRAFIRFWFDRTNRRQLTALSGAISQVTDSTVRTILWCALSRLIITKQAGASLAMDVSHSRPHKVFNIAPIKPLKQFLSAMDAVLRRSPFSTQENFPRATVQRADARKLPLGDESVDLVITSPPYLNAIDYLRGHKLSLVWMGHNLEEIRNLRSTNIGTERSSLFAPDEDFVRFGLKEMGSIGQLPERCRRMLARYVYDMNAVLSEVSRVLRQRAEAVLVVGDSTIRGTFVRNSRALIYLGWANGLTLRSTRRRSLVENRRYLPPPGKKVSGEQLRARMKEEVILTFQKTR